MQKGKLLTPTNRAELSFECPKCAERRSAPYEQGGNKTVCSKCGMELEIPTREDVWGNPLVALMMLADWSTSDVEVALTYYHGASADARRQTNAEICEALKRPLIHDPASVEVYMQNPSHQEGGVEIRHVLLAERLGYVAFSHDGVRATDYGRAFMDEFRQQRVQAEKDLMRTLDEIDPPWHLRLMRWFLGTVIVIAVLALLFAIPRCGGR